jgi:hypothetical protein
MTLPWYWQALGYDGDQPPVLTLASLRAARVNRLAELKLAGAGPAEIARVNLAFDEAKRHTTDK